MIRSIGKIYTFVQSFLVDLIQLIVFIIFGINYLRNLYKNILLDNFNFQLMLAFILGLVVIFSLTIFIKDKYNAIKIANAENTLLTNIPEIGNSTQLPSQIDIIKLLPDTFILKAALVIAESEALKWSSDATIDSFTLYFKRNNNNYESRLQMYFYSKIKNLTITKYFFNKVVTTGTIQEPETTFHLPVPLLFINIRKWKKIVQKAYSVISDHIDNDFQINIHSGEKIIVKFYYESSGVSKEVRFDYDENKLRRTALLPPYEVFQIIDI